MTTDPSTPTPRPSLGGFLLGIVVSLLGLFLIANAALATAIQVSVIGWVAVLAGVLGLVACFTDRARGRLWQHLVPAALTLAVGLMILRHPLAGAAAFTMLIGAVFFAQGISQVMLADALGRERWWLLASGIVSLVCGLLVMFDLFAMSLTLLGVLLGLQMLLSGLRLALGMRR